MLPEKTSYTEFKNEVITQEMRNRLDEMLHYIKKKTREIAPDAGLKNEAVEAIEYIAGFALKHTDQRYLLSGFLRLSDGPVYEPIIATGKYIEACSTECFLTEREIPMQKITWLWSVLILLYHREITVSVFLEKYKNLEYQTEKGIDQWAQILKGRRNLKLNPKRQLKKLKLKLVRFYRFVTPTKIEIIITGK
ncbi:MAG: hypothetical protein CMF28_06185 [Kiritimatiellaceae bacterium]|nr:hypothetical protein [Kiritimatiellaceae bacterium]|tara:strand:- start:113 stop:691 length:579 start_codon:yes stop_codon:yes gene_type:complete